MSISQPEVRRFRRAMAEALHRHWGLYFAEGLFLVVLGALAIVVPPIATLAVTIFVAWLFLVSGVLGLVTTFWMHGPGFFWSLISAILAIVAGALLIAQPVLGTFSLTLVLIAFFIIEGIASIMFALDHRNELPSGWVWMLASGLVDLGLGVLLFVGLPSTAAWAIGLLVGINLVFGGVSLTVMALHARRLGETLAA